MVQNRIVQTTLILDRVAIGSLEHLLPIFIAIVVGGLFIWKAKTSENPQPYHHIFSAVGFLMSLMVFSYHIYHILYSNYSIQTDLPLYLCSLLAIIMPIYTCRARYWMFEILVFWVIAGTLNAVITPDISEGFPGFDYFRYWVVHLGLLFIIFYSVFVLKMRPRLKSVLKSFLALQVYVMGMVIVNYLLDANYFYLNEKPKSATLLDYFGDWPYYILVTQLIVVPLFLVIYLLFRVFERKNPSKITS